MATRKKVQNLSEESMRPLPADAVGRETREVTTTFSEEEMILKNDQHTQRALELEDIETEFAEIKADYQGRLKEGRASQKTLLQEIRTGKVTRAVLCDMIPDHENNIMQFVDEYGAVVDSRRLKPTEKQRDIAHDASRGTGTQG